MSDNRGAPPELTEEFDRRMNASEIAAAIARGTDEFGRPNLQPFDEAMLVPMRNPPPSTAQAGLRTGAGFGEYPVIPGPNPSFAANMRPSTMIEDRRDKGMPSNLPRRDWLEAALSNALTDSGPSELETALLERGLDMSSLKDK